MLRANLQKIEIFGAFLGSQACALHALPSAPRAGYTLHQCEVNTVAGLLVRRAWSNDIVFLEK